MLVSGLFTFPPSTHPDALSGKRAYQAGRQFVGDEENRLVEYGISCLMAAGVCPDAGHDRLLIVGATGTGKSLLSEGLATCFAQERGVRVLRTNGSDWARFVVRDRTHDRIQAWRHSCRDISLLVFDDLDHLAGRIAAQHELCWLLDDLGEWDIPVVLTANVLPLDPDAVAAELASRAMAGLTICLRPPGKSARAVIIRELSRELGWILSDEAIQWLATRLTGPVPEIRGNLFRTLPIRRPSEAHASLAQIQKLVITQQASPRLVPQTIMRLVARHYGISKSAMMGKSRRRAALQARDGDLPHSPALWPYLADDRSPVWQS